MGDFAPAEMDGCFDLVAILKNSRRVILLEVVVVLIGAGAELDLLDGDEGLFRLGLLGFLLLLVLPFAEVNDSTDWRRRRRRYFNEVEPFFARDCQGLLRRHYSQLRTVIVDYANLADPYA